MQQLEPLIYRLLPKLADLGASATLEGVYPLTRYQRGAEEYVVSDGLHYSLLLSNTGGAVLLTGTVTATAQARCARCLERATLEVAGEVEGYFLIRPKDDELDLEDDEFSVVDAKGIVDLAHALFAALIFETPQVLLCSEGCKGLCPTCGANLNEGPCDCAHDPSSASPFSALKDLF